VFGQYSPLALLANVLILPLIPLAMLLTFIAGMGGIAIPTFAEIIGMPAEVVMRYMTFTVDKLAAQPLAASEIAISGTHLVVGYCFILVAMIFLWRRTGYEFREYNIIE
jgi:competence protein ComEC